MLSIIFSPRIRLPPPSTLFPYTTLFRSGRQDRDRLLIKLAAAEIERGEIAATIVWHIHGNAPAIGGAPDHRLDPDRKSTRLNSSHLGISYAVFCLKKKKTTRSADDLM